MTGSLLLFFLKPTHGFSLLHSVSHYKAEITEARLICTSLKKLRHGLCNLKSLAFSFLIRRLQYVLIFSILCRPCSFIVDHYLFDVFLSY